MLRCGKYPCVLPTRPLLQLEVCWVFVIRVGSVRTLGILITGASAILISQRKLHFLFQNIFIIRITLGEDKETLNRKSAHDTWDSAPVLISDAPSFHPCVNIREPCSISICFFFFFYFMCNGVLPVCMSV